MRIVLSAICGLLALAVAAAVPASGMTRSGGAQGIFVVRPDPRACPSPVCGGYWASLANRARTICHDGLHRPRCYVAAARDGSSGQTTSVPPNSLAEGLLGSDRFGDFGDFGVLLVEQAWSPVGRAPPAGDFYSLRDTGIRCIRSPCFSIRALRLNGRGRAISISSLDLGPAATGALRRRAESDLRSVRRLLAAGRVSESADGGSLFRATQVYLKASTPRA
jgi:hypothetical protein